MISATSSATTAIYYTPVPAPAAVASRASESCDCGVETAEGESFFPEKQPIETLSREKRDLLARLRGDLASLEEQLLTDQPAEPGAAAAGENPATLSEEEQAVVEELQKQDRETRAHEQAHAAIGGAYAGAPTYEYEIGPDGQRYAVAGEVQIDAAPVPGDPEATLEKMRVVERAALAPAEPSGQDRKVAQMAKAAAQEAQAEAGAESAAERRGEREAAETAKAGYAAGRAAGADAAPIPVFALAA